MHPSQASPMQRRLAVLSQFARQEGRRPELQEFARRALAGARGEPAGYPRALGQYVRDNVSYVPAARQVVARVPSRLAMGAGNCADMACAIVTLATAAGLVTGLRGAYVPGAGWHAWATVSGEEVDGTREGLRPPAEATLWA